MNQENLSQFPTGAQEKIIELQYKRIRYTNIFLQN